jgi:hypothetical protein
VGVQAALSLNKETFHRFPSADEVFVGSSHDVVYSWLPVGCGWAFEEDEWGVFSPLINGGLEGVFFHPLFQERRFQTHGVQFTCR